MSAGLFGLPRMAAVFGAVPSAAVRVPLPAAATLTPVLLPAQVKEELTDRLLSGRQEGHRDAFKIKAKKRCRSFRCNLRTDTSSAAAPRKLVFCLSGVPFAECLYGFSVASCGCFTSSDGSMFFMGMMLKAYRY